MNWLLLEMGPLRVAGEAWKGGLQGCTSPYPLSRSVPPPRVVLWYRPNLTAAILKYPHTQTEVSQGWGFTFIHILDKCQKTGCSPTHYSCIARINCSKGSSQTQPRVGKRNISSFYYFLSVFHIFFLNLVLWQGGSPTPEGLPWICHW